MSKKAQEIYDELRSLEARAAQLVPESPEFHRAEHKIMTAANAVQDWLSANKDHKPKPVQDQVNPEFKQQQQQQQRSHPTTKEDFLKIFEGASPSQLAQEKKHCETQLAKTPDRADVKAALEAINELLTKAKS